MPIIHDLDKTMKANIDEFYDNASVYRTNKFFVGMFGEYVKLAVDKMEFRSKSSNGNAKIIKGSHIYEDAFNKWKGTFYSTFEHPKTKMLLGQVDMRWSCVDISVPHTSSAISTENYIDSIKSIKYPIIKGASDTGDVVINVRDDKNMMWYQFFNALNNCFYRAQILKPRSSFQKVSLYVAPIQEQFVKSESFKENGKARESTIDSVVSQVFEFNSAVLKNISSMNLSNENKAILEYKVTFAVPNTFQSSFNNTYEGLVDNTSDGVDSRMMVGNTYNDDAFTIKNDASTLKTHQNGYYKDLKD